VATCDDETAADKDDCRYLEDLGKLADGVEEDDVVARLGEQFRDNSGESFARNQEHPGSQELIWGLGDYPITPEAHMRHIISLGNECLTEAELALNAVTKNREDATRVYNSMKAYKLLADYYERKVLAATSALIVSFGGPESNKHDAETFADEAVARYEEVITFIWEEIDHKSGNMKGRWLDGVPMTLPDLIEREKTERKQLPELFKW
jgi:hypothetical protein